MLGKIHQLLRGILQRYSNISLGKVPEENKIPDRPECQRQWDHRISGMPPVFLNSALEWDGNDATIRKQKEYGPVQILLSS